MHDAAKELLEQGYQARREHRLAEGKRHFANAADQSRKAGDLRLLARSLAGLGQIERDVQELDAAAGHYADAVQILRGVDEPLALAHTIRHLGDILRNQRQFGQAEPCYLEAIDIYRANNATALLDLANTLRGYALVKSAVNDPEQAKLLWQQAGSLYAAVGVQAGVDESEAQLARLSG